MKVLLVTPPSVNTNAPYPATTYLTAHLRGLGVDVEQRDWSIGVANKILSPDGLELIKDMVSGSDPISARFLADYHHHRRVIELVSSFLSGRNPSGEFFLNRRGSLPYGKLVEKFWKRSDLENYGPHWRARLFATAYLCDLAGVVATVDEHYGVCSFGNELGRKSYFDKMVSVKQNGIVGAILDELIAAERVRIPDVVGITVPFHGTIVGSLMAAKKIRVEFPDAKIVIGGGYVTNYLRRVSDPRLFELIDYSVLDDGERPLELILDHVVGSASDDDLLRTHILGSDGSVRYCEGRDCDVSFAESATPTTSGLHLDRYLGVFDSFMSDRIWATPWNSLTLAHGCYWGKCSFCDVSLDYVARYEPKKSERIVDQIEAMIAETGCRGFHWVDEAAPPSLLRAVATRLIQRDIGISWWGNVRFEEAFTDDLVDLLVRSGCVGISAGLEVASDRLLALMNKGVTIRQVARVANRFSSRGVLVHAYLIYAFPSQTTQEMIDSLEVVRQMFVEGCFDNARWHRLEVTTTSAIGLNPGSFGVELLESDPGRLGQFELDYRDTNIGYEGQRLRDRLGVSMVTALSAWLNGHGLELDVGLWFADEVPATTVVAGLINRCLREPTALGVVG